jgi:2-polyprenyl-3-methyl-5-hydroxy-6-metoxy-1,4-benzoquinol methylase
MSFETHGPDYLLENRRHWDEQASDWVKAGERAWASEPNWGMWGIPEPEVQMLPRDMSGMRAIELGCGTGYISAWMARRGAKVTAIDLSERQLATARRLASQHGIDIEWVHGNAERVARPNSSFDFAVSEYGASLWADPEVWIVEAARLLRTGGRLAMLTSHPFAALCAPLDGSIVNEQLHRPYFDMRRFDWTGVEVKPGGIEFNLTITDWLRLLRRSGFALEDLVELRCPYDGDETPYFIPARWAYRYPSELVLKAVRL